MWGPFADEVPVNANGPAITFRDIGHIKVTSRVGTSYCCFFVIMCLFHVRTGANCPIQLHRITE